MAESYGENSNIKVLARQKIDSLLPLIQKKSTKMGSEEIRFFPYDSLRNDFNLIILVDKRGIIIDTKSRKRALKKEIYTFYVKS